MNTYFCFDVETGGIGLDKSLLQIGGIILDSKLNCLEEFEWNLVPNDGIYHVSANSLEITGFDLRTHKQGSCTYKEAGTKLFNLLQTYYCRNRLDLGGKGFLIPIGKSYKSDIEIIQDKLISQTSWDRFVSYTGIGLDCVLRFNELCSGKQVEDFSLGQTGFHSALQDCRLTIERLKECLEIPLRQ